MQLRIANLEKKFGGMVAVDACSFECASSTITALVGPNGSGKSTIFNIITGVIRPDAGEVCLGDERLSGRRPHEIARRGIGRTFQTTRLFKSLSVLDNILLGATNGNSEALAHEGRMLLAEFDLVDRADAYARALSFGQQRLVELARALIAKPRFVLLDEPFAGMSPAMAMDLQRHVSALPKRGIGVLLIEHNLAIVKELCPRVLVLHRGRVIADGAPDALNRDPLVIAAYIGDAGAVEA